MFSASPLAASRAMSTTYRKMKVKMKMKMKMVNKIGGTSCNSLNCPPNFRPVITVNVLENFGRHYCWWPIFRTTLNTPISFCDSRNQHSRGVMFETVCIFVFVPIYQCTYVFSFLQNLPRYNSTFHET